MEHIREIDLIELVARRLDPARREVTQAHLQDCPACHERYEGLRRTWDLLGVWEVRPQAPEFKPSAGAPRQTSPRSVIHFPRLAVARAAAAIAVALLAGYAGGRWSVRSTPTGASLEPPAYLSALGLELGESFSPLVLQDEPSVGEEG